MYQKSWYTQLFFCFIENISISKIEVISVVVGYFLFYITHELNQIGIKIDMYRQEYRFTPAFAFIQAV